MQVTIRPAANQASITFVLLSSNSFDTTVNATGPAGTTQKSTCVIAFAFQFTRLRVIESCYYSDFCHFELGMTRAATS